MSALGKSVGISRTMRNVGADASSSATRKAIATSTGANKPLKTVSRMTGPIHKGSAAGLNNQHIVRLEANGTGYMNPRHQTARFAQRKQMPVAAYGSAGVTPKTNRTFDSRLNCRPDSSISRMKKLLG